MGLKDQLIQKMNDDKNEVVEEEIVEHVEQDTSLDDELFSEDTSTDEEDDDLSGLFDDDSNEPEDVIEIPDEEEEEVLEGVDFDDESTFEPEPEPDTIPKRNLKKDSRSKNVKNNSFSYRNDTTMDNSELESLLLTKAKETVLMDIENNYESEMFTKPLITKLIDSYISGKPSDMSNSDAIFTSILDEVIDSEYNHDYYQDLVRDILESVKNDIN